MKNLTQRKWVEQRLLTNGSISRNECLRNYISRLGAIIADLKKDGWDFEAYYKDVKTPFGTGKDYEYKLIYAPDEKVSA